MRGIKEGAGDKKGKLSALVQENNNRLEMISTGEWKQKRRVLEKEGGK